MLKEFKEFAIKGNMIDLAVGMIIGSAFSKIVSSLVNDIIMPLLGLLTGRVDFTNLFIALDGKSYETLAAAEEAGVACVKYGTFIAGIIDFLLMAFVVFLFVRQINRLRSRKNAPEPVTAPTTKVCPFCKSEIAIEATRCPHCTSEQPEVK